MTSAEKGLSALLARWFTFLVGLYPGRFRALFGDELKTVFARRLAAARRQGKVAVLRLCLLEFGGVGAAIVMEWWALWRREEAEMNESEMTVAGVEGRRGAFLAALPHLLVALVALAVWGLASLERSPLWLQPVVKMALLAAERRIPGPSLELILELVMLPALALALAVAWRRGWPRWSGSWAGYGIALGFTFLLMDVGRMVQETSATGAAVAPEMVLRLLNSGLWAVWLAGGLGALMLLARRDAMAAMLGLAPMLAVIFPWVSSDVQAPALLALLALLALVAAAVAARVYRARRLVVGAALVTAHCLVIAMPVSYVSLVEHAYLPPFYGQLTPADVAASLGLSLIGTMIWLLPPLLLVLWAGWKGQQMRGVGGG